MLKEQDHTHEPQDDRSRCPNCIVNAAAETLTPFESAALDWYLENSMGWAATVGIAAREYSRLGLRGEKKRAFIRAMNLCEKWYGVMAEDMREEAATDGRGGE